MSRNLPEKDSVETAEHREEQEEGDGAKDDKHSGE